MEHQTEETKLGDDVRSIAVLRALQLGDLLCAVPAWRALRRAYPHTRIALIGLPWAEEFVARFRRYLDEFIEFPGFPGLPEREPDVGRLPAFFASMQERRFDCVLQMQGGGRYANEFAVLCGSRKPAGFYAPPEYCPNPSSFMPYPEGTPEIHRHLRLMNFLGIPAEDDALEFPLMDDDRAEFHCLPESADLLSGSYICLHPGGRRPSHRWAPERFASVGDRLAAEGFQIVLTGTPPERELASAVTAAMQSHAVNLVGRTSLGSLGVLLSRARLLVSNDTGVSHMAAALALPSVIACIGSDPVRWSPVNRRLHRVLVGGDTQAEAVIAEARDLLLGGRKGDQGVQAGATALRSSRSRRYAKEPRLRLRVLTWHVHGNYLYYLSHAPHDFFLPVGRSGPGYAGCAPGFPWPANVHEVPIDALPHREFDCILFQARQHYLVDQFELLTEEQRQLPRLYLEHDPPLEHPSETYHPVDDPDMLLIHVTHFNRLMWNSRRTPTCVIEHGVVVPDHLSYRGELRKGLVIVNHLRQRGRRLGADLFDAVRARVPLDLVGMDSLCAGGLGEIGHDELPEWMCRYRFVFHPIRYTSLGLALCEAMALGVPPVALATTEAPMVIQNGVSGYLDTNVDALIERMRHLLDKPEEAGRLGAGARAVARTRFGIARFARDWDATLTGFVAKGRRVPSLEAVWTAAERKVVR